MLWKGFLFSKHVIILRIVSDRDPKLKAKYWKCLKELKNIMLNIFTANHQRTNAQSYDSNALQYDTHPRTEEG